MKTIEEKDITRTCTRNGCSFILNVIHGEVVVPVTCPVCGFRDWDKPRRYKKPAQKPVDTGAAGN